MASDRRRHRNDARPEAATTAAVLGCAYILGRSVGGSAGMASAIVVGRGIGGVCFSGDILPCEARMAGERAGAGSVVSGWRIVDPDSQFTNDGSATFPSYGRQSRAADRTHH